MMYLRSSSHHWHRWQCCHRSIIKWIINIFAEIEAVKSACAADASSDTAAALVMRDDTNLDTLWGIMVYFF